MKFIDFFAGIGGMRLGLEQAGHTCIGFCEFDKFAKKSYRAIHNTEGEWFASDVRAVKPYDVPSADLWCFGFPCQDISVAGKQAGLQEGERSGLFYEIMRLLAGRRKEDRPRWLLIENVKNLLSISRGFDFARLLCEVGGYGYSLQWDTLNSKNFGVPQNRERVFIVGHLGEGRPPKIFPISGADGENTCKLQEITEKVRRAKRVYDPKGLACCLSAVGGGGGEKTGLYAIDLSYKDARITEQDRHGVAILPKVVQLGHGFNKGNEHDIAPTLTKSSYEHNNVLKVSGIYANTSADFQRGPLADCSRTLKGEKHDAAITDGVRIRRLTPLECWRLQGFPDEYFHKAKAAGVSDSQLYKQAGNAVTVNVAAAIGSKLMEAENEASKN